MDYIKVENFNAVKRCYQESERKPTKCETRFAKYISGNGLASGRILTTQ